MLRIREILKEKGLSNADLIVKLQDVTHDEKPLSKQYISNVINGRQTVSMSRLSEIAKALEVNEWELFASPLEVGAKTQENDEFIAMVRYRGDYYHAESIDELESMIADWKSNQNDENKKHS